MLTCKTHSQAEVFVGTSGGSRLYPEVREAELSVRVVSPYLGDHLVEVLLGCQEHGVDVRAIVSNDFGNARDLARLLVVQTTQLDTHRQTLSRYGSLFGAVTLPVALGLLSWGVLERSGAVIAAAVLLGLLAFLLVLFFQKLAIYVYSYSYRLNGLRVVPSPRCYPYGTKESAPPLC